MPNTRQLIISTGGGALMNTLHRLALAPLRATAAGLLVGLVLLVGCTAAPLPGPTAAPAPTAAPTPAPAPNATPASSASSRNVVRVGGIKVQLSNFPLFIAKARGYFEEQGLDVQLVEVSSGAELLPLLASAQLEAGVTSPGAALYNAIANNVPLKAVLDMSRDEPGEWGGSGMVVRSDLLDSGAIKTPADLRGKTIAVTGPGTATHMNAIRLLESNGLTENDVKIVSLTFADMISALGSKSIDAAEEAEPALTRGEEQGVLRRWISSGDISPGQQEVTMVITPGLAANRDLADRFVLALVQGARDYRAAFGAEKKDQEAVIGAVLPLFGTAYTADLLRKMPRPGLDPDGLVNGDSLKQQQAWYVAHGFVKTPVNIDDVVDNTFAARAKDTLSKR